MYKLYKFKRLKDTSSFSKYSQSICKECDDLFIPVNSTNTLCSDNCRSIAATRGYLLRTYNMTLESWLQLVITQKNCCKICGVKSTTESSLVVDHCHVSNRVRGLLCNNCNTAIGLLQDNQSVLQSAIRYLNDK